MARVVAIVQARTGSSRLPGKALMALAGRPMLAHVLERALAIDGVDCVALTTSASERDRVLASIASPLNIRMYLGSEWDVLGRMRDTAEVLDADVIMRLTGDCPFLAPDVSALVLRTFLCEQRGMDYVSNDTSRSGYPDGLDTEVFTRAALELAYEHADRQADREHVTPWIRRELNCGMLACPEGDWRSLKWSVDLPSDYSHAIALHQHLDRRAFGFADTLRAEHAIAQERHDQ